MNTVVTLDSGTIAVLVESFSDSPDVLKAVFSDFHESVGRLHDRIRHGIDTNNAEDMARAAHSLKSNASTVGALSMVDVLKEIETLGFSGKTSGCAALLARSEEAYQALIPAFAAVMDVAEAL